MGCESSSQIRFGRFSFPVRFIIPRFMPTLTRCDSDSVGGYRHKERRDRLLDILFVPLLLNLDERLIRYDSDVDLDWHMHEVSDGERRRVQIVSGLMAPWEMLLLDEVSLSFPPHNQRRCRLEKSNEE